jgi:diguanylate cyclase (GGDEF)-like protein
VADIIDEAGKQSRVFEDLMIFHSVARALTSSLDLDAILRSIMQQMEKFFQPESWALLMVDEERRDLYYVVAAGHAHDALKTIRIPFGEGIAGWVAQHGEPLIVSGAAEASQYSSSEGTPPEMHSAICIPVRSRLRTLGVIQLFNYQLDALTDYTITFLHILCDYAAIAIENARAVERIQELTITDDCTGLFNARHLATMLDLEVERARRFKTPLSIVFIDLDRFKQVNDLHGHLAGSRVLAEVAAALKGSLRRVDLAFRYGGDEFVVVLPQTAKSSAIEASLRLIYALRSRTFPAGEALEVKIRASFGIASFPEDAASANELIDRADEMMYTVKNSTRDSIAVAKMGKLEI